MLLDIFLRLDSRLEPADAESILQQIGRMGASRDGFLKQIQGVDQLGRVVHITDIGCSERARSYNPHQAVQRGVVVKRFAGGTRK